MSCEKTTTFCGSSGKVMMSGSGRQAKKIIVAKIAKGMNIFFIKN